MDAPLVTIVVVTRNAAATLATALESIRRQTVRAEVVVVDGASTDDTLEIVRGFGNVVTCVVSEPDRGVYDAMNKGIAIARGEWLYFLGADDELHAPDTLARVERTLRRRDVDLVYGDVLFDGSLFYGGTFTKWRLCRANVCHQAMFFRRRVFDELGVFSLEYPLLADYAFNIRAFGDRRVRTQHVDLVIAHFDRGGRSSRRPDVAFWRDWEHLVARAFGRRYVWLTVLLKGRPTADLRPSAG